MKYLNKKEKDVLECFIKNIKASELPVYEISLFGSKARGDFNKDSDIDVLILVDGVENVELMIKVFNVGFDSMVEILGEDETIPFRKVVIFSEDIAESQKFIDNIEKDKAILWKR